MELQDLKTKYNKYDLTACAASPKWYFKWYSKKRTLLLTLVALLICSAFFICGYYIGASGQHVVNASSDITTVSYVTDETSNRIIHTTESVTALSTQSDSNVPVFENRSSTVELNGTSENLKSTVEMEVTTPVTFEPTTTEWDDVCPKLTGDCPESYEGVPPILLVSLDGFHPDFLERGMTPTLKNLSICGSSAEMYPVFPSKTFPTHYSIVTGLNPSSHGIIDNNMYDPKVGKMFKVGTAESRQPYWWEKEPIWVTAQKQGKKSGCYFWPGSDVVINGIRPNYFVKYSSKIPFGKRVDEILKWLNFPKESRPDFLTLYVNQPDHNAHKYGSNSTEVNEALVKVDEMIDRLFAGLQQRNLLNCVNVIIVSDHGMADTSCTRLVNLYEYINVTETHMSLGPFGRLRPKGKFNATAIETILHRLQCKNDNMRAYLKEQLPIRWHFSNHRRIEPIFLDLDSGWTISSRKTGPNDPFCSGASHGYDNYYESMRAFFVAHGPSFKFNNTVEKFVSTELYEMMCEILNIKANDNNGTRGSLHHLLKNPVELFQENLTYNAIAPEIPTDTMDYNCRVHSASCPCSQFDEKQKDEYNRTELNAKHIPFGMPYNSDNVSLNILYHEDFISAFDLKYRLPMWSSFTISEKFNATDEIPCWRGDARISTNPSCADYNVTMISEYGILQQPLFSMSFSNNFEEVSLVTNSVPKHENHVLLIEKNIDKMLIEFYEDKGTLNVVTGPAFDLSADGNQPDIDTIMATHEKYGPLVVPTHYFYVVTWCTNVSVPHLSECNSSELDVVSFLLPNVPMSYNCEAPKDLIKKHLARVVDIEVLTGILFYLDLHVYDAIRLRTKVPQL